MLGARVAAEGVWEARAPLPIATGELIGAAVDERPVLTGGLGPEWSVSSRVFTYDPAGDVWEGLPDLPAPLNHHAAAVANGILYVMGGATDFAHGMVERPDVYALSPGASAWEERAPMPEARWGHGAAAIDGKIYVAGGRRPEDAALMVYDPETDRWDLGPEMPTPRDHLGVVALDGLLYAVGGRVGSQNVGAAQVFDPETEGWTSAPDLPTPRSGMAVAVVSGRIHTAGGEDLEAGSVFDTHEAFDPLAEEWITLPPLPQATHGALGASVEDGFMVAGGSSRAGGQSALGWLDRADVFLRSESE
jgi:hypothetical protein